MKLSEVFKAANPNDPKGRLGPAISTFQVRTILFGAESPKMQGKREWNNIGMLFRVILDPEYVIARPIINEVEVPQTAPRYVLWSKEAPYNFPSRTQTWGAYETLEEIEERLPHVDWKIQGTGEWKTPNWKALLEEPLPSNPFITDSWEGWTSKAPEMSKQEQVRKAIEEIAAENNKDFGRGGWINLSLTSAEIQKYMEIVMGIEMPIVEIEQINEACDHASLIDELKHP